MQTSDKPFVERLNQLIDTNLDNTAFSVDMICQTLGISRSQLHRILKEQTDLPTSLYIRKRRLVKASHLLATTDWRVSEIGDAVGITNPQNFSTYFIDEFKVSPTDFRKLHTKPPIVTEVQPILNHPDAVTLQPEPMSAKAIAKEPAQPRMLRWSGLMYVGIGIGLLLILGGSLSVWQQIRQADHAARPVRNSLALLPFINLGAADSNPACEGIMDDIHTSLSTIKNLKVIARSSSDNYKDTQKSIWQIGDELQAVNILKGSVLKTGDQLLVKVELIDTQDDIQVWSKKYSVAYKDIFGLSDQIVRDVIQQLKLTITPSVSEKLAQARTRNLEAYNLFLQGRQLLVSRLEPDIMAGLRRFEQTLALDSTFAEAYAQKAIAYHLLVGSKIIDTPTLNRLTEENALKAIRLEPTNSTAYSILGSLYYATYQWQASSNAFQIALQYNPNDAQTYHWFGLLMRTTGHINEAVKYSTQAIALDPLQPVMMSGYINNCAMAGRFDLAAAGIDAGRGLFDKSFAFQLAKAYYWLYQRDYSQAVTYFQQMLVLNPDDKGQIPLQMYCEAKRGNRQKAVQFLRELKATTPRSDYERSVVYAGLNQADSCLYFLKKAADGGYLYRDTKVIPPFKPYHTHPVFKAVLRQFKLPEE